jgi:hypothetical protein
MPPLTYSGFFVNVGVVFGSLFSELPTVATDATVSALITRFMCWDLQPFLPPVDPIALKVRYLSRPHSKPTTSYQRKSRLQGKVAT